MCVHPASRWSAGADACGLGFVTASLLVDVVDLTTAAILGSVGLDAAEVRRPPPSSGTNDERAARGRAG
jgi:hypothetical protein